MRFCGDKENLSQNILINFTDCDVHIFTKINSEDKISKLSFHSIILGSKQTELRNKFFNNNFNCMIADSGQLNFILDPDISFNDVEKFVEFLYQGSSTMNSKELPSTKFLVDLFNLEVKLEQEEKEDESIQETVKAESEDIKEEMQENKGKIFRCPHPGCFRGYLSEDHWVADSHGHEDGQICGACGKLFNSHVKLKVHYAIHSGRRDFECEECGQKFIKKYSKKVHIATKHMKRKPYICREVDCVKSFAEEGYFKRHLLQYHGIENNDWFPCRFDGCEKFYRRKGDLQNHANEHMAKDLKRI